MNEPEVFALADLTLKSVVDQIQDTQWSIKLPEWFQRSKTQADISLRELINYHAYDDAWVPDMLSGKTMEEVGKTKFDGDLLRENPRANFAAIVDKAVRAAQEFDDLAMVVHCSFGDFSAREYFWQINMFRTLRARDIARLISVNDTLPENLVEAVWGEISPHAEEWRKIGVFGPAVDVPKNASLQDKLIGLTGRQV